jgi:hypothetical protein
MKSALRFAPTTFVGAGWVNLQGTMIVVLKLVKKIKHATNDIPDNHISDRPADLSYL